MWTHEGFYGLFKGNGVNVVRIAPFSAFEFFFYEFYKRLLTPSFYVADFFLYKETGVRG